MKKILSKVWVSVLLTMVVVQSALATITFPAIDLDDYEVAVGVVLTGIGAIWVVRKFIKLGNRS